LSLRQHLDPGVYLDALRTLFGRTAGPEHFDDVRWPAPMLSRLCGDALQAGIAVELVAQLIRLRNLHPEGPEVLHWPWPMRVYTLGRFSLVRDGKAVTFRGKSPRKPLELLQVLIALGGRDVHISQLMNALWSASDGRDLRKLFDNTLHRLRQILDHEEVVVLRDAKLTLDGRLCWVDAWAFDSIAGRLCEGEAVPQHLAHEVRRLYQGHFLQRDAQEAWLLPYAERMRSRFHRFILVQGDRLELAGQWESACEMYEHAIEIDSLAETLYRRLMVCLLHRGEFAEVVRVYRRCCDLLSIVLGVKPSLETEAIRLRVDDR
jgi:DNA-binding SARP family transcriptional activator